MVRHDQASWQSLPLTHLSESFAPSSTKATIPAIARQECGIELGDAGPCRRPQRGPTLPSIEVLAQPKGGSSRASPRGAFGVKPMPSRLPLAGWRRARLTQRSRRHRTKISIVPYAVHPPTQLFGESNICAPWFRPSWPRHELSTKPTFDPPAHPSRMDVCTEWRIDSPSSAQLAARPPGRHDLRSLLAMRL